MDRFDLYRDSVEGLPSCQLEVQLYQKKVQELAGSRDKLAQMAKEVGAASCRAGPGSGVGLGRPIPPATH